MDVVLAHIQYLHHTKSNIKCFLLYWVGAICLFYLKGYRPESVEKWLSLIMYCGVISVGLLILVAFCILFTAVLISSPKKGTIGTHEFRILDDGFWEKTEIKETLTSWNKVRSVWINDLFILIKSVSYFHIIPKRSFLTQEQFQQFYESILSQWNNSKSHNNAHAL
ncbi:hypothetical protein D1AOALGA4SA_10238 [Olavius algarvensis Delta 1 endosymbiont]|nr:hypothetical protein D1AOALGA4SA_10238 [Olavius algarvensis Delta 1 endosymbiont]